MTQVEENPNVTVDRRNETRVTYTAILGFKELKGRKIPVASRKPNATASDLSFNGICFISRKRPKSELLTVFLPNGARTVVRVVSVISDDDPKQHKIHCEVVEWLREGTTTRAPRKT